MNSQSNNTLFTVVAVLVVGGGLGLAVAIFFNNSPGNERDLVRSEEALDPIPPEKEAVAPKLVQEEGGDLAASEPLGDCLAILGDEARFGETWVQAGDMLGDAEVLEVGVAEVTFEWQGEIIIRPLAEADVAKRLDKDMLAKAKADIQDKHAKEVAAINDIVAKIEAAAFGTRQGYNDMRDQIYRGFDAGKLSQEDAMAQIEGKVRRSVAEGGLLPEEAQAELDKAREVIYR